MGILTHDITWRLKRLYDKSYSDEYVEYYRTYLESKTPEWFEDVLAIQQNKLFRVYLQLMLLVDCSIDECCKFFGCDAKVIETYKALFYDIDPIKHSKIKLLDLARQCIDEDERNLKLLALRLGKPFVLWYIGISDKMDTQVQELYKNRIINGLLIKALGHEIDHNPDHVKVYQKLAKFSIENMSQQIS